MNGVNNDFNNVINTFLDMDISQMSEADLQILSASVDEAIAQILKSDSDVDLGNLTALANKYGLTLPTGDANVYSFTVAASFASAIFEGMIEMYADQKAINRMNAFSEGQLAIELTKAEADKMIAAAWTQFAFSMASGIANIAAGSVGVGYASAGKSELANCIANIGSGIAKIFEASGQLGATLIQAQIKDLQAESEQARNMKESISKLAETFHEIITKSLSTMESLQQSSTQTRNKLYS